jgi:hypothetical protein
MASSTQGTGQPQWSSGRGFASMDPERQREVVGFVRSGPIATSQPARAAAERTVRAQRLDWMRVQADRDATFEGSSSRRGR